MRAAVRPLSPHDGQRIRGNAHSDRQSEQSSVRRPLVSGSSRSTAASGAAPQWGHAARAPASPEAGPAAAGSGAAPLDALAASASAMGCRKARGKNSSDAASQSSDPATAATGRPPSASPSSSDIAAGSADNRPATARSRSVADAGTARTKR